MPVNSVPSMGWTRRSAAISVLLVLEEQRKRAGERVVMLREARSWSQETLATHSGLSVKTVSRFENGRHEGRNETVRKLAKALKVNEVDITGPPPAPLGLDRANVEVVQAPVFDPELSAIVQNMIPAELAALRESVDALRQERAEEAETVRRLLERQDLILQSIEALVSTQLRATHEDINAAAETLTGAAAQLDQTIAQALEGLESAPPPRPASKRKTAPKRSRRASRPTPG